MKVSIITTVLNEESSIEQLLYSLIKQSHEPNEIVVADGGSSDNTVKIIESLCKKYKLIQLIKLQNANISQGRNAAIKKARYPVIAQIDGGCVAKRDWLEKIVASFKDENVEMVAGFYEMQAENSFARALRPFVGVTSKQYDKRKFLPSGRSVAFRKNVWEKVGGYDERLDMAGEDTLFNYKVLKTGAKIRRVKNAVVYWKVPSTFSGAMRKFYHYAKGDAQTFIYWHPEQKMSSHFLKIMSIYARYLLFLSLFFVGMPIASLIVISYLVWSIWKMAGLVAVASLIFVPIIQVSSDIAVMSGFLVGILSRFHTNNIQ